MRASLIGEIAVIPLFAAIVCIVQETYRAVNVLMSNSFIFLGFCSRRSYTGTVPSDYFRIHHGHYGFRHLFKTVPLISLEGVMSRSQILLVEDDAEVLQTIHEALARAGFEVREAHGVLQALKDIVERPPDIVITDIIMPDGGGPSLVKFIRNTAPATMVIGLTGVDLSERCVKRFQYCGGSSIASVLRKPVRLKQLIACLGELQK